MLTIYDIRQEAEPGGITALYCKACNMRLGGLQLSPPEGVDSNEWETRVRGEIALLLKDHEDVCPKRSGA